MIAALAAVLSDAWAELRTHKLRVLLSLIGVAVAVGALTSVIALGEYQKQLSAEQSDRWGGRIATVSINVSSTDGTPIDWAARDAEFERVAERYGFSRTSRIADGQIVLPVQLDDGVTSVPVRLMDPDYPVMHRLQLESGRWFAASDLDLLATPVIISEPLWDRLGRIPLSAHPTLELTGELAGTYPIVGVLPRDGEWDTTLRFDMLYDGYARQVDALPSETSIGREIWLGADVVDEIAPVLAMDLRAALPAGLALQLNRTDWGAQQGFEQSALMMQLVTGAVAGLVLLLGALGLVNIQLVAMRQRVREIGVRRSFGATSGRIFTTVMFESVVATTLAGGVGIALSVIVLRSPLLQDSLFATLQDVPPFPFVAALIGLASAVFVGALAGLIPAIVALRVKVIDAIRF